ncbi:MAG TPA: ribonuclease HI [Gaiellales bacterium]|jgi:ribonuclease HI|nr:ribonuclease HI [Gaiellales bacterium]
MPETAGAEVLLVPDGAVSGNPGPGGWAVVLQKGGHRKELSGGEPHTTNNRMELRAVIEGLKALKRPCRVRVQSDSAYVVNAHRQGWLRNWQRNGWRTASKKPVENQDLWEDLMAAEARHEITWELVKGHAGHELNERADLLAVQAREQVARGG